MAPHRRRQPQFRLRALQRRHVLHRRRQASAGPDRDHGEEPARGRGQLVLHRAEGLRGAAAYFRADAELRNTFFQRLKVLWFAGAALSQSVFDEMQELALKSCGAHLFLTGLGSTGADRGDRAHGRGKDSTNMGVPVPGVELKLVAMRGQARGAAARAQHHAGLLAPASSPPGVRCRRLLQAR